MKQDDIRYSRMSDELKETCVNSFDKAIMMGSSVRHAIMVSACITFDLSQRQRNCRTKDEAFAACCAVLIMFDRIPYEREKGALAITSTP